MKTTPRDSKNLLKPIIKENPFRTHLSPRNLPQNPKSNSLRAPSPNQNSEPPESPLPQIYSPQYFGQNPPSRIKISHLKSLRRQILKKKNSSRSQLSNSRSHPRSENNYYSSSRRKSKIIRTNSEAYSQKVSQKSTIRTNFQFRFSLSIFVDWVDRMDREG